MFYYYFSYTIKRRHYKPFTIVNSEAFNIVSDDTHELNTKLSKRKLSNSQ